MWTYVLLAVIVIGLAYWLMKRRKGDSGPSGGQPMPPPSGPSMPPSGQM